MKKLNIASNLQLPIEAVTSTDVIYGGKGMGKTNFGNVLAEELYRANARFSVIDPMGVWWGLQHGRTKDQSGIEVLILGGIHGDLPIEPTAGAIVADLVVDETISVIIDISRTASGKAWSRGQKIRFVTDYMIRLYERQVEKRIPIKQIIDEAARFAPQNFVAGDKDVAHCLGAIEMVAEEGRNIGIGLTLITLRSAKLNKAVAELADMLIAFRVVGPNSIQAILDWFGSHIPKERHRELVEQLRQLPVGTALVISPGWLKIEASAQIRLRDTFDSSATPKIGQNLRAPGKGRKPDLEKYRSLMAETIEKAKADDPKLLKAENKKLKIEIEKLRSAPAPAPIMGKAPKPQNIPIPTLDRVAVADIIQAGIDAEERIMETAKDAIDKFKGHLHEMRQRIGEIKKKKPNMSDLEALGIYINGGHRIPPMANGGSIPELPKAPEAPRRIDPPRPTPDGNGSLNALHHSMINGMALLHHIGEPNPSMAQVGAVIGKSHKSGRIRGAFNFTRDQGYSEINGNNIRLTDQGREIAQIPNIQSRADIHDLWYQRLSGNELEFLKVLIKAWPNEKPLTLCGEAIGKDMRSGRIRGALNALRDKGLAIIDEDNQTAIASSLLFPEGLN